MRMSENLNISFDKKEGIGSLQKNQERWKVITGHDVDQKALGVLGGEKAIDLIKSGWKKQVSNKGFDKTSEEVEALGGATNIMTLEKLSNYSQELGTVTSEESKIVDPEFPEVSERNKMVFKVVNGAEWNNLEENEKQLLGREENVDLVRSAWNKQKAIDGSGALKTAEELMVLTGNKGAAGIDGLMKDTEKMVDYEKMMGSNSQKREILAEKRRELEEKYNLSEEEKLIMNPAAEVVEGGIGNDVDQSKNIEEVEFKSGLEESKNEPEIVDLPPVERAIDSNEDPSIIDLQPNVIEGVESKVDDLPQVEVEKASLDLKDAFARYYQLAKGINLTPEEKDELEGLLVIIQDNREEYREWRKTGTQPEQIRNKQFQAVDNNENESVAKNKEDEEEEDEEVEKRKGLFGRIMDRFRSLEGRSEAVKERVGLPVETFLDRISRSFNEMTVKLRTSMASANENEFKLYNSGPVPWSYYRPERVSTQGEKLFNLDSQRQSILAAEIDEATKRIQEVQLAMEGLLKESRAQEEEYRLQVNALNELVDTLRG